jgi:UDP-N-acetylglucosamine 2-epimerase (non-hydrolysing)
MKSAMVTVGTRPEIIKMAPLIRALLKSKIPFIFVHCGQHYDYNMSQLFIEELELPPPDYGYKVKAYSQGEQTARIITRIERLLKITSPSIVLVEGDTNGVLATAIAAVKLGVPVGHVEAGLRSFDLRMPEEHNRRLTDHISTYLFAPTENAENNLKMENVWGKIYVTGNTVIDAVIQHLPIAEKKSKILEIVRFKQFALATAHRAENVDNLPVLKSFMEAFAEAPVPVVYPMHPRTKKRLQQHKIYTKIRKIKERADLATTWLFRLSSFNEKMRNYSDRFWRHTRRSNGAMCKKTCLGRPPLHREARSRQSWFRKSRRGRKTKYIESNGKNVRDSKGNCQRSRLMETGGLAKKLLK